MLRSKDKDSQNLAFLTLLQMVKENDPKYSDHLKAFCVINIPKIYRDKLKKSIYKRVVDDYTVLNSMKNSQVVNFIIKNK